MKKPYLFKRALAILTSFSLTLGFCLFCAPSPQAAPTVSLAEPATESEKTFCVSELPSNIRYAIPEEKHNDTVYLTPSEADRNDLFTLRVENPVTGKGTLTVHSSPIKYVDETGTLRFIDTAMVALTAREKKSSAYAYRNAANAFTVEYGQTAASGLRFDGAFTLTPQRGDGPEKAETGNMADSGEAVLLIEEGNGRLRYPGVFGTGTGLEYVNITNGIKESIILDRYTGQSRFDFTFRSATHIPFLSEDKTYILVAPKDKPDEPSYRFLSLFAYDSYTPGGEVSGFRHCNEDLTYDLTDHGNGQYTVTVVVPEDYLTHPEVVYPVTIDPSVTWTNEESNAHDTFVNEATPTSTKYYNYDYIRFGTSNGKKMFGYHRFTSLPTMSTGTNITSAVLTLTVRSGQTTPTKSSGVKFAALQVEAHQWNESTITWNNQPYGTEGYIVDFIYDSTGKYLHHVDANLTDSVCSWYSGSPNYGVDFTYNNEMYDDHNSVVSSEGDASKAPVLKIDYVTTGINDRQTYYLRNKNSGKYLEVPNGSSTNGTDLIQRTFNGGISQQFRLFYNPTTLDYTLYPMCAPGLAVEVTSTSAADNAILQIWQKPSSGVMRSQRFRIVKNSDGSFTVLSFASNYKKAMVIKNASTADNAAIVQYAPSGLANEKWILEARATKGQYTHKGNLYIGMSSDNYPSNMCDLGGRVAGQTADYFGQFLGGSGYNNVSFSILFNRKTGVASKSDFLSKSRFSNSNPNIDDVHLMLFVGHGRETQGLHFANVAHGGNHNGANINLPRSEATFGEGNAKTRWVVTYTCNFLTGTEASVKSTFRGINALMGYRSLCYIDRDQMAEFAKKIKSGEKIVDSWLSLGHYHTKHLDTDGIYEVYFVDEAQNDTLYKYLIDAGDYRGENIYKRTKVYSK